MKKMNAVLHVLVVFAIMFSIFTIFTGVTIADERFDCPLNTPYNECYKIPNQDCCYCPPQAPVPGTICW